MAVDLTTWKLPSVARFITLAAAFTALGIRADVRLPGLFSDNAVLQQGAPIPIWGWADDGERVTVSFRGKSVSAVAQNGTWRVEVPKQKAGGPFNLVVEGKNRIERKDILVGEVWVCSGQSNMEWPLNRSFQPDQDIAASANPNLRLFTVPKLRSNEPVNDIKAGWQECGPETVKGFSAVGYYFGRDLQKALGVPVGLIHTSWGGSPAEVWMSRAVLESNPRYKTEILDPYIESKRRYDEELAKWQKETDDLKKDGKPAARGQPWTPWKPTELYNGMIAPLIPYRINGAIWYQGESNAGRADQYRTLFADMIRNWRRDWDQGDFTFVAVQLAPWDKGKKRSIEQIAASPGDSDWAELREAQNLAAQVLPNVGVAVITDVGDKDDIHPNKKGPVGARLALQAEKIAYKKKIAAAGPTYKSVKIDGNKVTLRFVDADGGLEARGGPLTGFAVCGADRKFVWADAEIRGDKVIVSSISIPNPVAVRYGWSDYPVVNLFNRAGLPASPFRTDDFPLTTAPKK
jgi:sialate O-acetylesterase